MATFKQAFEKDTTFIFGSWVCTADDTGGWNRYLKPGEKKEKETLGEIQLADMIKGHEYEFKTFKAQAQASTTLFELDPPSNSITHPTRPMFGLRNAATIYQEAVRTKIESALGLNTNIPT